MELKALGITPAKERQFNKKNIFTVEDLINFFPRKYYDLSEITGLLPEELISCIIMKITDVKCYNNNTPLIIASGIDTDSEQRVKVMWFRQSYLYHRICNLTGRDVFVAGKAIYNEEYHNYSITSPLAFTSDINSGMGILSVYSKIQNMSDEYLSIRVKEALSHTELIEDLLPPSLLRDENLISLDRAVSELHNPTSMEYLERAEYRMVFDDLLYFAARIEQLNRRSSKGSPYNIKNLKLFNTIKNSLPYTLTEDQGKTIQSMIDHIKEGRRINALIQGDVGCGKSITAFLMMAAMVGSGYQAALMAPTQVLAKQHYDDLKKIFNKYDINIAFLGGQNMKKSEREKTLEGIKNGSIDIVVGTHAILNKEVQFKNLAITITDEEHRFGSMQREALLEKASNGVHSITMSATPIPRSLAQVIYGNEIQLYAIKTMPAGRLPVKTAICSNQAAVFKFIKKQISEGFQVYVVCPMIDQNENMNGVSSIEEIEKIYKKEFKENDISIATLTGKNSKAETNEIIDGFKNKKNQILISTTVIEVGVNVPNATTIVIHNAERFGLASLHQLRGRVGRSTQQSYCILFSNDKDNERLNVLVSTNDGFKVAEEDLRIRGTGNIIGTEQSGYNKYVSLMLSHQKLYYHLKDLVQTLLDTGEIDEFIENRLEKERDE